MPKRGTRYGKDAGKSKKKMQAQIIPYIALISKERRLRREESMLSNCGAGEDSWESLGQ